MIFFIAVLSGWHFHCHVFSLDLNVVFFIETLGYYGSLVQHEKAATFLDILKSFFSSDTRQSMKRRITTKRLFTIYIARCRIHNLYSQITNPECAKTYTDDNFRIIGQGRSSFHLSVLESVYIKTQNPVLCKQKDFIFSLGIFK